MQRCIMTTIKMLNCWYSPPREGGYIIDFFSKKDVTKKVVERVSNALNNAVKEAQQSGLENAETISKSVETRRAQIASQKIFTS